MKKIYMIVVCLSSQLAASDSSCTWPLFEATCHSQDTDSQSSALFPLLAITGSTLVFTLLALNEKYRIRNSIFDNTIRALREEIDAIRREEVQQTSECQIATPQASSHNHR